MAHIKLNSECLIGGDWREKDEIVEVSDAEAAAHVKAGSGTLVESPPAGESLPPDEPPPTKGPSQKP